MRLSLLSLKSLVFFFVFISEVALAASFQARVEAIHDGDTINITLAGNKKGRVRLMGTDSPEIEVNGQTQGEAAIRARDYLRAMLPIGATLTVNTKDDELTDKHNRFLGQLVYNGVDLNREMLRAGWSAFYMIAPYDKTLAKEYSAVAKEAYFAGRGIYSQEFPNLLLPYIFRPIVMKQPGRNLVGNLETKELFSNEDVEKVPPYARMFFPNLESAKARGFFMN